MSNLNQFNNFRNINDTILDYVLCNVDVLVSSCHDPLVPEDDHHKSLVVILDFDSCEPLKQNPRVKYLYHSGDYDGINSCLCDLNWSVVLGNESLDIALDSFYASLNELRDKFIPPKTNEFSNISPLVQRPP